MTTYSTGIVSLSTGTTTYNAGSLNWNNNDKLLVTIRTPVQLVNPDFWPGTAEIERFSTAGSNIEGATAGNDAIYSGGDTGKHYISPQASTNVITNVTTYYDKSFTIARSTASSGSYYVTVQGVEQGKNGTSGSTYSARINFTWADTVPNGFNFIDKTNAAINTVYYSFAQITGFSTTATVSITSGNVTTAVSSSSAQPSAASFTSSNKSITQNQYLHVRMTSASSFNSSVFGTVSVNGVSDTWVVTTGAQDTLPDVFTFGATQYNAALDQYYYRVAQVTGFTGTLQASATTNTYRGSVPDLQWDVSNSSSLSGVSFQYQPHSITSGQYLHVRVRASSSPETTTGGTMFVGQRGAGFLVVTVDSDTVPNTYSFTDVTNANLNTTFYDSAQITGINEAALATGIFGMTVAATSTNSQPADSAFGAGPILVEPNYYLWAKMTSSSNYSTQVFGAASVGGVASYWRVTTRASDLTPNDFSFGSVTNAITQAYYTALAQITGVEPNYNVPVSISGGVSDFAVSSSSTIPASSAFSSNPKTITNSQYVHVRLRASSSVSTSTTANLTVGTLTRSFTVTTGASQTPGSGGDSVAGSDVGLGSHGLIVYGIDGVTPVFGNIRSSSLQVDQTFTLTGGGTLTISCSAANDSTKVLIEVTANASSQQENLSVTTTSTSFTITNNSQYSISGRAIANRIA